MMEESRVSEQRHMKLLRARRTGGGKFFPPKLMPAVIDTLVEISFVNKPGGPCAVQRESMNARLIVDSLHFSGDKFLPTHFQ